MKANYKKSFYSSCITNLVLIIVTCIPVFCLFNSLDQVIIAIIVSISLVYLKGYYRYIYFKNNKGTVSYEIKKLFGFIPIYDAKFVKKEVVRKEDYIIINLIIPIFLISFLFSILQLSNLLLINKLLNMNTHEAIKYSIFVLFLFVFIFELGDLKSIILLYFNSKILFIEMLDFEYKLKALDDKFKPHHSSIYLIEKDYKDYLVKDLKREKIRLEGKLEREKKPAFYDMYILPLIVIFVSGILSIISSYINTFMFSKGNVDSLNAALRAYIMFALMLLGTTFFASFMIRKVSYNSIEDLKSRILVIEERIIQIDQEINKNVVS